MLPGPSGWPVVDQDSTLCGDCASPAGDGGRIELGRGRRGACGKDGGRIEQGGRWEVRACLKWAITLDYDTATNVIDTLVNELTSELDTQ